MAKIRKTFSRAAKRLPRKTLSVSRVFDRGVTVLTKPVPLALLIVAIVLYLTHLEGAAEKNFVKRLAVKLNTVDFLKPLAKWVNNNAVHVVGLAALAVPIFAVIPSKERVMVGLFGVLYVMLVPQAAALDYVWQASLLFSWQLARSSQNRFAVLCIGVIGYVSEWYTFKLH